MDYYSYPVEVDFISSLVTQKTQTWTEKNIGHWGQSWIRKGGENSQFRVTHIYYFKEEKDAIMFALKWK